MKKFFKNPLLMIPLKKSALDILKIVLKTVGLIVLTTMAVYFLTGTQRNFYKILETIGLVMMVLGVATLIEKFKFGIVNAVSGLMILILSATVLSGWGYNALSEEERLEDLEYMHEMISENYPLLASNKRVTGIDWLEEKEIYVENVQKDMSDMSEVRADTMFGVELIRYLGRLNNNLTHLVDAFFYQNHTPHENLEYENDFTLWEEVLLNEGSLDWYKYDENETGIPNPYEKELLDENDPRLNHHMRNYPASRSAIVTPDEVAYLRLYGMPEYRVDADQELIRNFLEEVKDYDKLLIDIRGSMGGVDSYWQQNLVAPLIDDTLSVGNYFFIRGDYTKKFYDSRGIELLPVSDLDADILEKMPEEVKTDFDYYGIHEVAVDPIDPVGFQGEIFLLTDDWVGGASERFASYMKDSGMATLVGKTTRRNTIVFEPLLFSLPNSGLIIRYRGEMLVNGDGNVTSEIGTIPHVHIEDTTNRFPAFNEDRVVRYILDNY